MKLQLAFLTAYLVPLAMVAAPVGETRPNLLFLLTDDQRADTLGERADRAILTPHLDVLAQQSTEFRNAFVTSSVCAVSRASILLGQYAHHSGIEDFATPLSEEQHSETYAALLRESGYYTGFIGKWGIGADKLEELDRAAQGFDVWDGYSHQGNYWHEGDCAWVNREERCDCPAPGDAKGYQPRTGQHGFENPVHLTTEVVPGRVRDFLEHRDAEKPFCLSISFKAPHGPWQDAPREIFDLYENQRLQIPETATEEAALRQPEFLRQSLEAGRGLDLVRQPEELRKWMRFYYQMVTTLDQSIGSIREALEEAGVAKNTIIIFTSDNGHFLGEHGFFGKWLMHEPSIRVPLLIHHPAKPGHLYCDEMVLNLDLAPTMLDLAGVPIPESMDGRSLVPLLTNPTPTNPFRQHWLYEHHFTLPPPMSIPASEGIRTPNMKYVRYLREEPVVEYLFDLEDDPMERNNLATTRPETLLQMRTLWLSYHLTRRH